MTDNLGNSGTAGTVAKTVANTAKPVSGLVQALRKGDKKNAAKSGVYAGSAIIGGVAGAYLGGNTGEAISDLINVIGDLSIELAMPEQESTPVIVVTEDGNKTIASKPQAVTSARTIDADGTVINKTS